MTLVFLLIIILFVWRLTHLISQEDGPFNIIFNVRKFVGDGFFGKLMDCFYCLSIWISLIPAIYFGDNLLQKIILCFAFSGGAIILEKLTNKNV